MFSTSNHSPSGLSVVRSPLGDNEKNGKNAYSGNISSLDPLIPSLEDPPTQTSTHRLPLSWLEWAGWCKDRLMSSRQAEPQADNVELQAVLSTEGELLQEAAVKDPKRGSWDKILGSKFCTPTKKAVVCMVLTATGGGLLVWFNWYRTAGSETADLGPDDGTTRTTPSIPEATTGRGRSYEEILKAIMNITPVSYYASER